MESFISRRTAIAQMAAGSAVACQSATAIGRAPQSAGQPVAPPVPSQQEGIFHLYTSRVRPLVMMSAGDSLPIPVMFDTGSNGNMVDTAVALELGLVRKPNHQSFITDASGTTIEAYAAHVPDMRVGALPVARNLVDVYDYRVDDEVGILGPNLFRDSAIYLNFPKNVVYVRDAPSSRRNVPNAIGYSGANGDGLPMIDISVEGLSAGLLGVIDTGKSDELSFPESMIDKLPLTAPPTVVGTATTVFTSVPVLGAKIDGAVRIGTVTLMSPDVIFHGDMPKVGLPVLEKQRIWLEPHNQRAWVARPTLLDRATAETFQCQFGERRIWLDQDTLIYQRQGRPRFRLEYLGADHFQFVGDDTEVILRRTDDGTISGFTLLGASGDPYEVSA